MISTFVRADRLRLASLFCGEEEGFRRYLAGVYVEPCSAGGVRLVATNGHIFGMFHDPDGFTDHSCIIALPAALKIAICRAKPASGAWFGIVGEHTGRGRVLARLATPLKTIDGPTYRTKPVRRALAPDVARVIIEDPTHEAVGWQGGVELIDGDFPEYARIIPKQMPHKSPPSTLQQHYLKVFAEVASFDNPGSAKTLTVYGGEDAGCPSAVLTPRDDFFGIVMPVRDQTLGLRDTGNHLEPMPWVLAPVTKPAPAVQRAAA
jgi:hypothetical protein